MHCLEQHSRTLRLSLPGHLNWNVIHPAHPKIASELERKKKEGSFPPSFFSGTDNAAINGAFNPPPPYLTLAFEEPAYVNLKKIAMIFFAEQCTSREKLKP